jgi:PAS domain S-box-containing protein
MPSPSLTLDVVRALLDSAPDAGVVTRDGRIELANGAAERLFGYGRDELLGQTVEMLLPERLHAGHVAHRRVWTHSGGDGTAASSRSRSP